MPMQAARATTTSVTTTTDTSDHHFLQACFLKGKNYSRARVAAAWKFAAGRRIEFVAQYSPTEGQFSESLHP